MIEFCEYFIKVLLFELFLDCIFYWTTFFFLIEELQALTELLLVLVVCVVFLSILATVPEPW